MMAVSHGPSECAGQYCPGHNPSEHHMRDWPITVRYDRWCMTERICPHGCGHPDPDSVAWMKREGIYGFAGGSVHGCDGCCRKPIETKEDA